MLATNRQFALLQLILIFGPVLRSGMVPELIGSRRCGKSLTLEQGLHGCSCFLLLFNSFNTLSHSSYLPFTTNLKTKQLFSDAFRPELIRHAGKAVLDLSKDLTHDFGTLHVTNEEKSPNTTYLSTPFNLHLRNPGPTSRARSCQSYLERRSSLQSLLKQHHLTANCTRSKRTYSRCPSFRAHPV